MLAIYTQRHMENSMFVKIGAYPKDGQDQEIEVIVHKYDTYNADWTIATMVLPLLKKVKENKQGAPLVEDMHVPEHLRSTSAPPKENEWDTDANHFKRWDYALDEMLFAMQEIASNYENEPEVFVWPKENEHLPLTEQVRLSIKIPGAEEAFKAYHARVQNGCVLFGTYFQSLWT